jgi:hypothetical protein
MRPEQIAVRLPNTKLPIVIGAPGKALPVWSAHERVKRTSSDASGRQLEHTMWRRRFAYLRSDTELATQVASPCKHSTVFSDCNCVLITASDAGDGHEL